MSNQKLNQYIKEVAVKVGMHQKNHLKQNNPSLFEKQTFKITKGGKTTQTTHEKWEKIQSHTARRS